MARLVWCKREGGGSLRLRVVGVRVRVRGRFLVRDVLSWAGVAVGVVIGGGIRCGGSGGSVGRWGVLCHRRRGGDLGVVGASVGRVFCWVVVLGFAFAFFVLRTKTSIWLKCSLDVAGVIFHPL